MLVLLVLVGTALRIHGLNSALWYDEIVTLVESVRMPFSTLLTQFPSNNNHVLYSLLGRVSVAAFGEQAWSLRFPAVVFGIAALPMLYVLGASVTSRLEAVAAMALLAVSYHHIWFSQNARGYTILLFCALLMTHLLLNGLREGRRYAYVQYGLVAALSAYTHLTMVLFVIGHAVVIASYLLARGGWRFVWLDWRAPALGFVVAGLCTLVLYLPMLVDVRAFFGRASTGAAVATAGWALGEALRGLRLGFATSGAISVGGALFLLGCASYYRGDRLVLALYIIPGVLLLAAVLLMQRPTFPRFFFFLAGFALLIVVRGTAVACRWVADRANAGRRARDTLPVAVFAVMTLVSALALPAAYRYPKQDYERALEYVEASRRAGDVIVVAGGGAAVPYQEFYGRPWPRLSSAAELTSLRQRHEHVWVLYTFRRYIEALEPELMTSIGTNCTTATTFPGTVAGGEVVVARCAPT
jgi:4-amino-4-deoxy-L-arabinose transferase-like glycosyltransferase